jgi:hypothetical protein
MSSLKYGPIPDDAVKPEWILVMSLWLKSFGKVADKFAAEKLEKGHCRASAVLSMTAVKYAYANDDNLRTTLEARNFTDMRMYHLLHMLGSRHRATAILLLSQPWIEMSCLFAADFLQVMICLAKTGKSDPTTRLLVAEQSRLSLATARLDCILSQLALIAAGKNQILLEKARLKFVLFDPNTGIETEALVNLSLVISGDALPFDLLSPLLLGTVQDHARKVMSQLTGVAIDKVDLEKFVFWRSSSLQGKIRTNILGGGHEVGIGLYGSQIGVLSLQYEEDELVLSKMRAEEVAGMRERRNLRAVSEFELCNYYDTIFAAEPFTAVGHVSDDEVDSGILSSFGDESEEQDEVEGEENRSWGKAILRNLTDAVILAKKAFEDQGITESSMAELMAASDYSQPQPAEEREWIDAPAVGS